MLSAKVCRHRACWAFFIAHKLLFVVDWTVLRLCRGRRLPCVVVFRTPSTYRPVGDLSWGITTFCLGCVCATRHGPGIVYLYDHSVALWTSSRAKPLIGLREDSASCWPEKVQFTRLSCLTGTCVDSSCCDERAKEAFHPNKCGTNRLGALVTAATAKPQQWHKCSGLRDWIWALKNYIYDCSYYYYGRSIKVQFNLRNRKQANPVCA